MKRYIIFGFDHYYPMGGLYDILTTVETLDEVREHIGSIERGEDEDRSPCSEYQVLDTVTAEQVKFASYEEIV